MAVLYIILPLALILAAVALAAFFWSVHRGQMDDLDTPPVRMLFDDADGPQGDKPAPDGRGGPPLS
jgi:cbb3-type cytochrome oxidase maturation protein